MLRFSKEALLFLVGYAAALGVGVRFGWVAFAIAITIVYGAFKLRYPIRRATFSELSTRERLSIVVLLAIVLVGSAWWLVYDFPFAGWRSLALPLGFSFVAWSAIQQLRVSATHREEDALFEKASHLEKTDPAAAEQLLDSYFAAKAETDAQERAKLWDQAGQDRKAAVRLERILKEELRANDLMRRGLDAVPPEQRPAAAEFVQQQETRTCSDLERIRAIIQQLRP